MGRAAVLLPPLLPPLLCQVMFLRYCAAMMLLTGGSVLELRLPLGELMMGQVYACQRLHVTVRGQSWLWCNGGGDVSSQVSAL